MLFGFLGKILIDSLTSTTPMKKERGLLEEFFDIKDPITAVSDAIRDTIFDDTVEKPKVGSVVYCGLLFGTTKHSGIYVGYNKIVHLNGDGIVEKVSAEEFLDRLDGLNFAVDIYVSCLDGKPVGSKAVAERAKEMIGKKLKYDLIENNCHKFSSNCLTGSRKRKCIVESTFPDLETNTEDILGSNEWLVWERSS